MGQGPFLSMVFVVVYYYFPLRHNRWYMLLFEAWYLLLFIIIFHVDITDGTCYLLKHGICYCLFFHLDITDGTCYFLKHGVCYCLLLFSF